MELLKYTMTSGVVYQVRIFNCLHKKHVVKRFGEINLLVGGVEACC